jgi:acetyl/propionyl-CoA carboxylase alpha subunit
MGEAAVAAARAVGYAGAGTVEFLLERGRFYFLEMNTRLQVEHPITEETLGIDLVRAQLDVAAGGELPPGWRDGSLRPRGHAIELRLYAEDPVDFLPRSGRILVYREPSGPGVRVDAGVEEGSLVGVDYDPLLAKLVVSASSRAAAIARARRALADWIVLGVETNARLLDAVLASDRFASGAYTTDLIAELPPLGEPVPPDAAWIAAALAPSAAAGDSAAGARPAAQDPWNAYPSWRVGA